MKSNPQRVSKSMMLYSQKYVKPFAQNNLNTWLKRRKRLRKWTVTQFSSVKTSLLWGALKARTSSVIWQLAYVICLPITSWQWRLDLCPALLDELTRWVNPSSPVPIALQRSKFLKWIFSSTPVFCSDCSYVQRLNIKDQSMTVVQWSGKLSTLV